jgi:hypothetical protein
LRTLILWITNSSSVSNPRSSTSLDLLDEGEGIVARPGLGRRDRCGCLTVAGVRHA